MQIIIGALNPSVDTLRMLNTSQFDGGVQPPAALLAGQTGIWFVDVHKPLQIHNHPQSQSVSLWAEGLAILAMLDTHMWPAQMLWKLNLYSWNDRGHQRWLSTSCVCVCACVRVCVRNLLV